MADERMPAGTVSLLFTDIDGSTRLLQELGDAYADVLRDHHRILDEILAEHGGRRVDAAGDGMFIAFPSARAGLLASIDAQRSLAAHAWPRGAEVRVRMGLHSGEPITAATGYVGIDVHRAARICSAGHGGQVLVSDAARALIGTSVPSDVGFRDLGEHRLKDLAATVRIYQVTAPGLATDFPPVRSLETLPNNLPRQLSSFVGRDREIADARARLATTSLLTLTGPGGVGKTRLALELGAHVVDEYPDGVWFAEFAALDDPALVPETVATAVRVPQAAAGSVQGIAAELRDRRTLLIIDNCEHLLDALVALADPLLRACPNVKVIATSREALGMAGESLMPVPSMTLPEPDAVGAPDAVEQLAACDAVQLFVDRGRAVDPSFALTRENAEAVAQICRRLDGIPLAVELAAARLRSLPPAQIAARLDQRFRLLTGGSRTALPRHRTLRAAMDWSFDLLPEPERALMRRLCAFSGSFALDAAEAVAAGGPVAADEVIDLLGHLIDKSLLTPDVSAAEARYRMLETIRDYAQERLADTDEASAIHARHRDWFVGLVERARPGFFSGAEQAPWVTRLADDVDNLRGALQWSHDDPEGASAELSLASGLWRFWEMRGHLAEGSAWLAQALDRTGGEVSARRASALTGAGVLASHRGDHAAASAFHEASLLLQRELGDPLAIAAACSNMASIAAELGDVERARALYREGIATAEAAGDEQGAAFTTVNLADLAARHGDPAEADGLYARAIGTFEKLGNTWGTAQATARLAQAARRRSNPALARERYEEARSLYRRIDDGRGEARMLIGLGDVSADAGDTASAESHYREALALRHRLGDPVGVAGAIERLAGVSADRPERAAELVGASLGLREATGARLPAAARAEVDQFLAELEARIGREALQGALDAGRKRSLSEVLQLALG